MESEPNAGFDVSATLQLAAARRHGLVIERRAIENDAQKEIGMTILKTSTCSGKDSLRDVVGNIIAKGQLDLPLLPESISSLLKMCNDADCPPRLLAEGIRKDQSVATNVLRIANSAIYSGGSKIVSLQQAVARLGMAKLREIIMIVFCQGRTFQVDGFGNEVRRSFRHSLGTAAFASEVARELRANVEEAFLFGLLHDIGRPVLLQAIVDVQSQSGQTFDRQQVIDVVETFRISVGSSLISQWKLPQHVADAVLQQSASDLSAVSKDARILALAIKLTDQLLEDRDELELVYTDPVIDQLNLYPEQLDVIGIQRHIIHDLVFNTL